MRHRRPNVRWRAHGDAGPMARQISVFLSKDQTGFVRDLIAGETSDREASSTLPARRWDGAFVPVSKERAAIEIMIAGERSE